MTATLSPPVTVRAEWHGAQEFKMPYRLFNQTVGSLSRMTNTFTPVSFNSLGIHYDVKSATLAANELIKIPHPT